MRRCAGWLTAITLTIGCSSQSPTSTSSPPLVSSASPTAAVVAAGAPASPDGPVAGQNYPQEELARKKDALKITGKIEVPGFENGTLQIDVYPPVEKFEGQTPFTTARFKAPGPYGLLLPAGTTKVKFIAWLDFKSNGPDSSDATQEYPGVIDVREKHTGIDFKIDKKNTKLPPPEHTSNNASGGELPPWETTGAAAGTAGTGTAKSGPAPAGVPVPAPPGKAGGAAEEGAGAVAPPPKDAGAKTVKPAPEGAPGGPAVGSSASPAGASTAPAGAKPPSGGADEILKAAQTDRTATKPAGAK